MPQQPGLFPDLDPPDPTDPAPWIQDSKQDRSVATIVFAEVPWGPFDYLIPDALHDLVQAGRRVEVPLGRGNRKVTGYCVEVRHESELQKAPYSLKSITRVKDQTTLLSAEMLELTRWMACDVEYWPTINPDIFSGTRDQLLEQYRGLRDELIEKIADRFSP